MFVFGRPTNVNIRVFLGRAQSSSDERFVLSPAQLPISLIMTEPFWHRARSVFGNKVDPIYKECLLGGINNRLALWLFLGTLQFIIAIQLSNSVQFFSLEEIWIHVSLAETEDS
jgi:hypothetical protein